MSNKKRILFIAWDDPKVNYLEGLFVPIFERLVKDFGYEFHVIQFSWADGSRINFLTEYCSQRSIRYKHININRRPLAVLGKYFTLFKGIKMLKRYIKHTGIDIIMPRSTMPGKMALSLKRHFADLRIVFDADGLPIEERVDFAGLKRGTFRYNELKKIERNIIEKSTLVLARTRKAVDFLAEQYNVSESKFFVIQNGRDETMFRRGSNESRDRIKKSLSIPSHAKVCVYCGSLGPQYGVEQMLYIHRQLAKEGYYFLVLTNNPAYLTTRVDESQARYVVCKRLEFKDIPSYLAVADVAFAIRKATFSMRGVSPIKLGEYLLMGLPVIASADIGDTNELLYGQNFAFILDDYRQESMDHAVAWIKNLGNGEGIEQQARSFGERHFSLQQSALSYQGALVNLFK